MARQPKNKVKTLPFNQKLLLNQWIISLFGIDPLCEHMRDGKKVRPFHVLTESLKNCQEGLNKDANHYYLDVLKTTDFFRMQDCELSEEMLDRYEKNIIAHTFKINEGRVQPIVWKYFQWLSLLFTEIYLDRYFSNKEQLLDDLNQYVGRFNEHFANYLPITPYQLEDLNKVCLQNATGSGKTLLMHANLLQFKHYLQHSGKANEFNYAFLLTPNERLSIQHASEFAQSGLHAEKYSKDVADSFLTDIYYLEIQKLGETDGPNTIATRNLGDNNLLLVDEGHAGISGKNAKSEENAWMKNRAMLCGNGFSFEYSATFSQAVQSTGHVDDYAKAILFDYSYRWFYEDGYGKDYQIFNIPKTFDSLKFTYLVGALLKYYQQLKIYLDKGKDLATFNIEKPLWVFVGSTVSGGMKKEDKDVLTDIALIIEFFATFLNNPQHAKTTIHSLLHQTGTETGMLDSNNVDFFKKAFDYICKHEGDVDALYNAILKNLFSTDATGQLVLERVKGKSGEIALKVGTSAIPFGLINVGAAKELCDHISEKLDADYVLVKNDSEYTEAMFDSIKSSTSTVNLLIGSKKFVEGWDCWRVSTLGLMHVGQSEGAQIVQLFGRGVRLKGYRWSLKRSTHSNPPTLPKYLHELELLNVFGIKADFMQKFKAYLEEEGLPGNEHKYVEKIPLNVTYDFGKKLKVLRPKKKKDDGKEYDFKKDAPVPAIGDIPSYLVKNKIVADCYPRIQSVASLKKKDEQYVLKKESHVLSLLVIGLIDVNELFFTIERFKRERAWFNLNVDLTGIQNLLASSEWYTLYIPKERLEPKSMDDVLVIRDIVKDLVLRYVEKLYDYHKQNFIEPRLELRELSADDPNIPTETDYQLIVDANDETLIHSIQKLKDELAQKQEELIKYSGIESINMKMHLFQPLFHIKTTGQVAIMPVTLNTSEFKFVTDLKEYAKINQDELRERNLEIYLLRNLSRGRGVGFFEASNFHPDFILWVIKGDMQYINFIEPHGILHENLNSAKVMFVKTIKQIEARLNDPLVSLNSFILSCTNYNDLINNSISEDELTQKHHVLFMNHPHYIAQLLTLILPAKIQ